MEEKKEYQSSKNLIEDVLNASKQAIEVVKPLVEEVKDCCCPKPDVTTASKGLFVDEHSKKPLFLSKLESSVGEDEGCCCKRKPKLLSSEQVAANTKAHKFGFGVDRSKLPNPIGKGNEIAYVEFTKCNTLTDAKLWHLKWTPWFTEDAIDGIIREYKGLKNDLPPSPIKRREETTKLPEFKK